MEGEAALRCAADCLRRISPARPERVRSMRGFELGSVSAPLRRTGVAARRIPFDFGLYRPPERPSSAGSDKGGIAFKTPDPSEPRAFLALRWALFLPRFFRFCFLFSNTLSTLPCACVQTGVANRNSNSRPTGNKGRYENRKERNAGLFYFNEYTKMQLIIQFSPQDVPLEGNFALNQGQRVRQCPGLLHALPEHRAR